MAADDSSPRWPDDLGVADTAQLNRGDRAGPNESGAWRYLCTKEPARATTSNARGRTKNPTS